MIREIFSKSHTDDEFHVLDITGPTRLIFDKLQDGFIISSPTEEILFGWDYSSPEEFTKDNAMLLKPFDNMKDFKKITFTHLYLMPKDDGKMAQVYICAIK